MDNAKSNQIPTDLIIDSFRGGLSQEQKSELDSWLSEDGNKEKYEALRSSRTRQRR